LILFFSLFFQSTVCISSLFCMCHTSRQSQSWFDQPNDILFVVQITGVQLWVYSTPLSPRPSQAQISSSVPHSLTRTAYVCSAMWETGVHIGVTEISQTICILKYPRIE
jgi:hypothetical protein